MKKATIRDLRNHFSTLEAWLAEGEEIEIQKRGEPIALLSALPRRRGKRVRKPDFAARRRAIWESRVFSDEEVAKMRVYELEDEEG